MLVMLSGIVTDIRLAQFWNALPPMLVTVLGMISMSAFPGGHNNRVVPALLYTTPSKLENALLLASMLITVRALQPRKLL